MLEFIAVLGSNKKHMFSLNWSKLGLGTSQFTRRNKNKNNWKMSEQTDIIPWFITQAVLPHFTCVPWQRFDKYRKILLVKLESLFLKTKQWQVALSRHDFISALTQQASLCLTMQQWSPSPQTCWYCSTKIIQICYGYRWYTLTRMIQPY